MNHSNIKRGNEESLDRFLLRIGNDKEIYGLDNWHQIKDIMNAESNEDFSESKWRKDYHLLKRGYDLHQTEINPDEIVLLQEEKKLDAQKEYKKIQAVKNELNKNLNKAARREVMWDMIKDSIEKYPVPKFQPIIYPPTRDKVGVLSFADIHYGKYFKSLKNEYNEDIARDRMSLIMGEALEIIRQHGFEHIHIINGADSIEGMTLRTSQLQSLQSGIIDQTIKFSKFIASWLNVLSQYVRVTYHHVPSANHSEIRPFNSNRGEYPAEDLEKVIMNYIHDVLENNPRIEVPLYDKDYVKLDVFGYKVWALHGHQLKGKKNAIRDLSVLHREFIDYLYIAHFHHGGTLTVGEGLTNDVEIIQIPSVMGSDEYSDSLMTGAKAGANFSVYEKDKGRAISYTIKVN